jgi:hypothetical protein
VTLPVQLATIREFCPVCSDSATPGRVAAAVPGAECAVDISCPHCTDPRQLLNLIETSAPGRVA